MARNSEFHPFARREFDRAIDWYNDEKSGLDGRFARLVLKGVREIERNPLTGALAPLSMFKFIMPTTTALSPQVESTLDQLLKLPAEQRRAISERLADSLGVSAEWAQVAAQRAKELKSGAVAGVSIDEAFDQARRAIDAIRPTAS